MGTGEITEEEIAYSAKRILIFLKKEFGNIEIDFWDIEKKVGFSTSDVGGIPGSQISFEARPSDIEQIGATDYALSYLIPNKGFPLELRINPDKDRSMITLKSVSRFDGYESFNVDVYGNTTQTKRIDGCLIYDIKKELEYLAGFE